MFYNKFKLLKFTSSTIKLTLGLLTVTSGLSMLAASDAQAQSRIDINAKSYFVAHMDTDLTVLSENEDNLMGPASLTKLMTVTLLFDELKNNTLSLDSQLPISKKAWKMGGSKMFLRVDEKVKVEELIKGIIVSSGNDACITVAEFIAGNEDTFVSIMNDKAKKIGMENTVFTNASGWPHPEQVTTAKDMYKLAKYIIQTYPEFYHYFSLKSYEYNGIKQGNRNTLVSMQEGVDGMKTGHTEESGYHLLSSAVRKGQRIISVMMGTRSKKSRERQSLKAINYAYRTHSMFKVLEEGTIVENEAPVYMGEVESVKLLSTEDIYMYLPKKDRPKVTAEVNFNSPLEAPIKQGDKVGVMKITNPTTGQVYESPIVSSIDVPELGAIDRAIRYVSEMLGS